jgi:hypothetical protein
MSQDHQVFQAQLVHQVLQVTPVPQKDSQQQHPLQQLRDHCCIHPLALQSAFTHRVVTRFVGLLAAQVHKEIQVLKA